jgi:putative ABC transport system permease protein
VRQSTEELLQQSFGYSRAIELAALVVGLLGLLNTVFVNVIERSRELAMLRAVGMSIRQVRSMIFLETLMLGVAAAATSIALGAFLSRAWLAGSLSATLRWNVPIHVPFGAVSQALAVGTLVGALAGVAAAIRATRSTIREGLESEQ